MLIWWKGDLLSITPHKILVVWSLRQKNPCSPTLEWWIKTIQETHFAIVNWYHPCKGRWQVSDGPFYMWTKCEQSAISMTKWMGSDCWKFDSMMAKRFILSKPWNLFQHHHFIIISLVFLQFNPIFGNNKIIFHRESVHLRL